MNVTAGNYSLTGPRCMIKQMDGVREGRCLDTDSDDLQPGGAGRVFPCTNRWYQFLSFGDGVTTPKGSMFSTIPSHVLRQIHNLGHEQIPYMCLGVRGRGNGDEVPWDPEDEEDDNTSDHKGEEDDEGDGDGGLPPLTKWLDQEIVTTQCTNEGAVIEWIFVPFITEDYDIVDGADDSSNEKVTEADIAEIDDERDSPSNQSDTVDTKSATTLSSTDDETKTDGALHSTATATQDDEL